MSEMIWVAKRDGTGWASNRTRDIVDLAFTVKKEHGDHYSEVLIRSTWHSGEDARATRIIGRIYAVDHKSAKETIERVVKQANNDFTDKDAARVWLFNELLNSSLDEGAPGKVTYWYPYIIINNRYVKKTNTTPVAVTTSTASTIPTMVIPNSMPWDSTAAVLMSEKIKEATEIADKVLDLSQFKPGDPAPEGYIWMGKNLIQIGWPS